ncbi:ABC transporter substrate-binding protein [Actinomycetospora endophytica]|uniref:ABC transporter substrate-binding protein n=1 Tax=Actinomycetospora endophytica TaxID=2291215 RepID=A0ABS8PHT4_9PSEU|nr:ABC transporter substrate-binding protein [Actinomycetospora endophytica]MCD2197497.1 ABC transporter substrate-binding protein [Actinomycetospora endophytica]
MTPSRSARSLGAAVLATLGLLLAACGGGGDPLAQSPQAPSAADTVRIGSANFTENRLIAEIYATALSIKGVKVERQFGIGSRETYFPALRDGSIDLIPDYTGNLLQYLDPQATATAPADVYAQVQQKLPPALKVLQPSAAEDKDAVVVTKAFATQNNLRSITDLARLCTTVTFGGPPEFQTRAYGIPGLQKSYGCSFKEFRALDSGGPLTVAALRDNSVQAADLFTTDSSIPTNDFVILDDPKSNFAAQQVVPLVNGAKLADPTVANVLNQVSSKLDTATLTDLNRRLDGPDKPDPSQVARDWLSSAGIG